MRLFVFILFLLYSTCRCAPNNRDGQNKLESLRNEMKNKNYNAYIVVSEDEHQSEYVAKYDKRREWISGFTGSAGVAVITLNKSALWTDGRYFLQASLELDNNSWILMKDGEQNVPTIEEWLKQELKEGQVVAQNAKLTSISDWQSRENSLQQAKLSLKSPDTDLIDIIWTEDRPNKPNSDIKKHAIEYAGKTWQDKVKDVINRINQTGSDVFVVTALDEVAWLFNMRGTDIPYNPMFFAYAIIDKNGDAHLFINNSRLNDDIKQHLNGVIFHEYDQILKVITSLSESGKKVWISPMSSYAVYNAVVNKTQLYSARASPVRSIKAVKNEIELENARKCQIRDSAARLRHMHWLENEIKKGNEVTEVSSAKQLEEFQKKDPLFRGLSFGSISAVGAHAAIIHFSTNEKDNVKITRNDVYLLDAGAQYEDCSTDITRTHHFGTPTKKEILAYTKVLQGAIDLAKMVFPPTVKGRDIDVAARSYLWKSGLDYNHGTGHGIGYYLSIHEFPPRTKYTNNDPYDEAFAVGMFQSDEPGYYEDEKFGIRLETDIEVVKANTPFNWGNKTYLTFDTQTLLPFDANLIDVSLLDKSQVDWLNNYNQRIRKNVGELLKNEKDVYDYLMKKTEPFEYVDFTINYATKMQLSIMNTILIVLTSIIIKYF